MTGWDRIAGVDDLRALAPEAFAAMEGMRRCAAGVAVAEHGSASPDVAAYAEQFNLGVASLTADQRAAAASALGDDLFGFVQAVWALDMSDRVDHALRRLAPVDPPATVPDATAPGGSTNGTIDAAAMWTAIDAFLPAVARLRALDPVTTEVVRLRGARAHDCRLCRSLRSVGALEAGAREETFDAIDHYEASDLDERTKVALRLVDALIWEPRRWPDEVAGSVRAAYAPTEAVEIVLDVVRNAANKIAVALEADQAHVEGGVEYFSVDAAGNLTYGLDRPTAAVPGRAPRP